MKLITVLILGLLCAVLVNGRHFGDRDQSQPRDDEKYESRNNRDRTDEVQILRKRPTNYGHDFPPRSNYLDRRDSYNRNQDVIGEIFKILDDLANYIKRDQQGGQLSQPLPMQPIFVPYPMPFINCNPQTNMKEKFDVNVPNRGAFSIIEDENQNWGIFLNETLDTHKDISTPASVFESQSIPEKVTTTKATKEPPTTPAPNTSQSGFCNAAVLSCCGYTGEARQRQCFRNVGCETSYNSQICNKETIIKILDTFALKYATDN